MINYGTHFCMGALFCFRKLKCCSLDDRRDLDGSDLRQVACLVIQGRTKFTDILYFTYTLNTFITWYFFFKKLNVISNFVINLFPSVKFQ